MSPEARHDELRSLLMGIDILDLSNPTREAFLRWLELAGEKLHLEGYVPTEASRLEGARAIYLCCQLAVEHTTATPDECMEALERGTAAARAVIQSASEQN